MDMENMKEILADDEMEKILKATYMVSRSPVEISEIYGIPIARCYRKVKVLEDAGLLKATESKRDLRGRKVTYYRAQLKNAYVTYNGGVRIRFETLMNMSSSMKERILTP